LAYFSVFIGEWVFRIFRKMVILREIYFYWRRSFFRLARAQFIVTIEVRHPKK